MSEPVRSLIALMVSAALLSVAGIIRVNFLAPSQPRRSDHRQER